MKQQYLIRLDDACPTMNREKWGRMEELLKLYGIKPIVGVIPANADPKQMVDEADPEFWQKVQQWQRDGWTIAQHGYDHCYISFAAGMNPMWNKSEFAGVPLEVQQEKIMCGGKILHQHAITPTCFFAPSHTFDENTLTALRSCSDIRIISDGIAFRPYWQDDFCFIPQISGHCINMPWPGIYTFCFHPNAMDDQSFGKLQHFIIKYHNNFICLNELDLTRFGKKRFTDRILETLFFYYRKLRGYTKHSEHNNKTIKQ